MLENVWCLVSGCIATVWRLVCEAELAKASDDHFELVLWDLHKCYEMVDHELLIKAACKFGWTCTLRIENPKPQEKYIFRYIHMAASHYSMTREND